MSRALKILHLSDLHIPKEFINDRDFKTVKVNLLKDIEQQKKKYGKMDVAVFTGDFVDKGNVELFKEDMYTFISEVLDTAGIPKENVVFVPGNHDAKRPEGMVYEEIQKVRENCEVTNNKDDVGYMCKRFQPFVDFCMQFSESTIECDKSYGITDISLDDNEVYRFIRINSALATYDKNDYNNLFVTKVQLDDILRQMDDRIKPRITFLVMHHPMDWFTYEERVLLEEYIADETKFNVDIILNGHIHNGQVSLKSDLDTNIITLVSGVGYSRIKRKTSIYPDSYRYAVYCVEPDENKLIGALRISNQKKGFGPDTTLYKKINNDGVLTIPLKVDYGLSTRQLSIPMSTKVIVSDELLKTLDSVIVQLWKFEQQIKKDIDNIARKKGKKEQKVTQEDKINVFLFNLCCAFRTVFFPDVSSRDVRVHVRHYIPSIDTHRVVMSLYGDKTKSGPVTDMKWGDKNNLIYYSYIEKRTLLASINPDKTFHTTDSRWDEFLSLAVTYDGYKKNEIPAMSFGISFDWDNMEADEILQIMNILYCLSYVGLEHVMENVIEYASNKLKFKDYFNKIGGEYEFSQGGKKVNND
ncbi:MAG: metallophosphoesterase [Bariatricus sp.]|uniref:metallophosphoesterase family protein n=1 Tax=Blautia sp. HCP3S3_D9 TaxID=3438912 RepID=UPI002A8A5F86|nr:metallophosphoesterase [Bariatricus sp.]